MIGFSAADELVLFEVVGLDIRILRTVSTSTSAAPRACSRWPSPSCGSIETRCSMNSGAEPRRRRRNPPPITRGEPRDHHHPRDHRRRRRLNTKCPALPLTAKLRAREAGVRVALFSLASTFFKGF